MAAAHVRPRTDLQPRDTSSSMRMIPTSHDDAVGVSDSLALDPYPADSDFDLQLTDKEVDDALDFDLDFDAMAESMGNALPNIDLGDMGSLGTRSPSPSESISVVSKGSKRSRADFVELDSESECDSQRDAQAKRMVFTGGSSSFLNRSGSSLYADQQYQDDDRAPKKNVGGEGVPSSRCQTCGLQTHRTVMTEFGFELQPLNIEGEVDNGRCLLCDLLTEGETSDIYVEKSIRTDEVTSKSKKNDDGKKSTFEHHDVGTTGIAKMSPRPPPRVMKFNMGSPSPQHPQRQKIARGIQGNNVPLPPPPARDSQRWSSKGTPTPNQYHSKMALTRQAQLPRKHSAMEHARSAVGNSNNRGKSQGRQKSSSNRFSNGIKPGLNHVGGIGMRSPEIVDLVGSSGNVETDDNYSRGGGRGINMSMHCAETMSTKELHQSMPQQLHQHSMSFRSQSPHPQTPHSTSRSLSDQVPRPGSSTPQSVPVVINTMAARTPKSVSGKRNNIMTLSGQTPKTVPANNLNNSMISILSGGGGGGGPQTTQSVSSMHDMSIMGNAPSSIRLAHSKLQSSIYHHHIFPLDDDTERAHVEKTLKYIESGSGDVCDIIAAMRRFPFSPGAQRAACNKLYAHCIDQETAHAVGLVGGIRTTIDAMEHHPDDAALQLICCGLIKHLAMASTYNLDMLDRMGAVSIITTTMERHSMNAPLLEACCWAMESMARSPSSDLKMSVAQGGGIQAAMKAVETFPSNESLLKAAFHCLRQLGYNPSQYNSNNQQAYPQQQQQHRQQQVSNSQQQHTQSFNLHRFNGGGVVGGGGGGGGMPRDGGIMISNNIPTSPNMGNNKLMTGNSNSLMHNKNYSNQRT